MACDDYPALFYFPNSRSRASRDSTNRIPAEAMHRMLVVANTSPGDSPAKGRTFQKKSPALTIIVAPPAQE
jgi:hypothetical protein